MSENVRKLVGVVVMAVLVVAGVAVSSGDDTDFTRNTAFGVPKGAGLDDQVQQPGDAENEFEDMVAAAKCEEGRVLVSTGDLVSPWRCGPLLAELATVAEEASRATPWDRDSPRPPCHEAFVDVQNLEGQSSWTYQENKPEEELLVVYAVSQAMECLASWSSGHSVEDVDEEIDEWWIKIKRSCPGWPRPEALSANGIVYWIEFDGRCRNGWNPWFELHQ